MSNELTDRNCEKCVHHMNGYCDSWDCNMQTVDDVKKEAVNEYIKAVVEELEEAKHEICLSDDDLEHYQNGIDKAIEIVKQEAEKCNSGWIPCSERFPDECVPVNVTWINRNPEPYYAKIKDVPFSATAVYCNGKWYWYSSTCIDYLTEYGKNDFDLMDKDIDVIAWMDLPSAYIPKEK